MVPSPCPDRCLNCREPLRGRFCHHCGQRGTDLNQPLSQLIRELLATALAFDTRLFRTLRPLLFKPGFLTVEYNAGRRARYVPPLTLYVFISFVMFVALAMSGYSSVKVSERSDNAAAPPSAEAEASRESGTRPDVEVPDVEVPGTGEEAAESRDGDDGDGGDDGDDGEDGMVGVFLGRFFAAYEESPERFDAAFRDDLARAVFLLVPVFALLLKAVCLRSGKLYVQHLIMSFHLHCFAFIALTAGALVETLLDRQAQNLNPVVAIALAVYLFIALRRVYGGGRWWTGVKLLVLMTFYVVVLLVVMVATLVVTVTLF